MTAATLLSIGEGYLWAGLAVGVVFLGWGIDRIDKNARGAWVFRPLVLPGIMLIWPLVLWRWAVLERGWDEARRHRPPHRAQRIVSLAMAAGLVAIIALALSIRQNGPFERPALLLSAPETAPAPETGQ
ncbi:MAG: hypothetical protein AAGE13_05900 [Pseudomonadota bacterium]